jgi:hypothetical protein
MAVTLFVMLVLGILSDLIIGLLDDTLIRVQDAKEV